jgi:hypothetical protein
VWQCTATADSSSSICCPGYAKRLGIPMSPCSVTPKPAATSPPSSIVQSRRHMDTTLVLKPKEKKRSHRITAIDRPINKAYGHDTSRRD